MTKLPIKLAISAVCLAFVFASPAEAAKRKSHAASRQQVRTIDMYPARSTAVYYGDKYLGSDPDPRIRHELLRDLGAAFGGDN